MANSLQVNDYKEQANRYDRGIQLLALFQLLALVGAFFTFGLALIPMFIFLWWGDRLEKKRKKLWIFNSGREESSEALRDLPEEYTVLHNIEITSGKYMLHLNHVVVGPQGVFLVKAKNWGVSKVEGGAGDSQWTFYKKIYSHEEKNPIHQVKSQVHHLSNFLRENGIDAWVQGVVYLSNRASSYQIDIEELNRNSSVPVFMTDFSGEARVYDYIVEYPTKKTLSKMEQESVIDFLINVNTKRKGRQVA